MSIHRVARVASLALLWSGCQAGNNPLPAPTTPPVTLQVPAPEDGPIFEVPLTKSRASAAPVSLTASDGTGLRLVQLVARAVVDDPLAFTELRLVFENPNDRVVEGTFSITLPQGATVSRFAMLLENKWQEGEVVEKQAARRAYEDFLHRRQDPALLEQAAGNEFSARVFPIPARGRKELVISYSHEISGDIGYQLPLAGLPEVEQLDVVVHAEGRVHPIQGIRKAQFRPTGDLTLDRALVKPRDGVRSGNLAVARVSPVTDAQPDPLGAALILVDTSASRALGFEAQLALLDQLVKQVASSAGAATPLVVAGFDQSVEQIYRGEAGSFGARELDKLRSRKALGASDLAQALGWAGSQTRGAGLRRVILLSDGVPTTGATDRARLGPGAAELKNAGFERLDVVAVGGIRDDALLHQLATAGLARDGVVVDGASDPAVIGRKLGQRTTSKLAVQVEGARWWYPRQIDGAQLGDEILVYADLPEATPLRVRVGQNTRTPELASAPLPLVERAVAKARIDSLLEEESREGKTDGVRQQIIEQSIKHRVLSPYTSLLVLETEADYARFKIDRTALADILTIEGGKVSVSGRTRPPAPLLVATSESPPADAPPAEATKKETKTKAARADSPPPPPPPPPAAAPPSPASPSPAAAGASVAQEQPDPAPQPAGQPPPPPPPSPPQPGAIADKAVEESESAPRPRPGPVAMGDPSAAGPSLEGMQGDSVGESFGSGGLGLSGAGNGGGGTGDGIGLGGVGTLGRGAGAAAGQGFGAGQGRLGGSHRARPPSVRMGATTVNGRLPPEVIQRIVRQNFGRFRLCYENGLRNNPNLEGRVSTRFIITKDGSVSGVANAGSSLPDAGVVACVVRSFTSLSFPQPEGGIVTVVYPISFAPGDGGGTSRSGPEPEPIERPSTANPYSGRFKSVMDALARQDTKGALASAESWHREAPGDVLGLIALGEGLEAVGDTEGAARAYGSLIDLFPARADMRRFAGERLERLKGETALALAIDTYTQAREQRPDHPASHRLLGFALLRKGDHKRAFEVVAEGLKRDYPPGRFAGVKRILAEDLGLIAAVWAQAEPARRGEIMAQLKAAGGAEEKGPSLRFVLNWETDANDVDFHIYDEKGHHAFYGHKHLASGGDLYADVTTGYGPECFTVRKGKSERAAAYTLQANYYSRGPMGYGMGKLEVIDHDGRGHLTFDERPYVVMIDHAFVDLGVIKR